jgi:AraC-like DNA-binding protein
LVGDRAARDVEFRIVTMPRASTETALTVHHLANASARLGLDPTEVLDAAGLDPTSAATFEMRVPIERIHRAWEFAMRRLREPSLPVRAALVPRSEGRSPLALLMSSCATLRDAVGPLFKYGATVTDAFGWRMEEAADGVAFRFDAPVPRTLGERCHTEYHVADGVHSVRQWTRVEWFPVRVAFRHAAPPDLRAHEAHFGSGLSFGQVCTEVVLPRAVMDLPLATASRTLVDLLERHIRALAAREQNEQPHAARLRIAMLSEMQSGACIDLGRMARRMGTSQRTLHRRLADDGTTFQRVLDEARREVAEEMLSLPGARIKEVSLTLGYSDVRAFRRAYRRWTGHAARPER